MLQIAEKPTTDQLEARLAKLPAPQAALLRQASGGDEHLLDRLIRAYLAESGSARGQVGTDSRLLAELGPGASLGDTARAIRRSPDTVARWGAEGRIRISRAKGRRPIVDVESLIRFLERGRR